jgi:hypothetical protein
MAIEHRYWFVPPHVKDVDLIILRARGHERLAQTSKATVVGVESLLDTNEPPDEGSSFDIPHMKSLCGHVQESVSVSLVCGERHDSVILLDQRLV